MGFQRPDAVGDDLLAHERPHGVVQEDVALLLPQRLQRFRGGAVPGLAALQDLGHLGIGAGPENVPDRIEVPRRHHDDDLVDDLGRLERRDRVLDDRLSRDPDQLLGDVEADTFTRTAGQHDGDRSMSPHGRSPWGIGTPAAGGCGSGEREIVTAARR
ncbi:hypothetical protein U6N30_00330 [Blastococcus brunescens]|uniref:Uncharacterized protein n=1 Tax=Blastococcus brunescens TaxID=1564165 RepID=A0ABZ1B3C1_9ACTN|nr:hypothetical protein [Blastococcus sp. BMG 8361]WRL64353.1 hypothetical protein U6N30_00330 [Blastococcus sp. BMG 8361]